MKNIQPYYKFSFVKQSRHQMCGWDFYGIAGNLFTAEEIWGLCSFFRYNEVYTWNNVNNCVHNIIVGQLWIEQVCSRRFPPFLCTDTTPHQVNTTPCHTNIRPIPHHTNTTPTTNTNNQHQHHATTTPTPHHTNTTLTPTTNTMLHHTNNQHHTNTTPTPTPTTNTNTNNQHHTNTTPHHTNTTSHQHHITPTPHYHHTKTLELN